MRDSDTIFALATPAGRSALAVFRVSGPLAVQAMEKLSGRPAPADRRASVRAIFDASGGKIDDAVVTLFRGPRSYTGEDVVELSVHGSGSVVAALSHALGEIAGVRIAGPGEFTRRALLNGRIDLTQAEGIADLIDSETEFQRRQALRIMGGALGERLRQWKSQLLKAATILESALDFNDEGDVGDFDSAAVQEISIGLTTNIRSEISASSRSLALKNGFTVAITGPPNAGKSSLFNLLVGSDAAIVTAVPGTTRDVLSRTIDLDGAPLVVLDTAGLRQSDDEVELIGMARAQEAARNANLILWLIPPDGHGELSVQLGTPVLPVHSKSDLGYSDRDGIGLSIYDPDSIVRLRKRLYEAAIQVVGDGTQGRLIRQRHIRALEAAVGSIEDMARNARSGQIELAAEDCRIAMREIGMLVGETTNEELLGEIFARFCIGK